MRALIDADILAYEFGGMKQLEDPEKPLEWEITRSLVDDRINEIVAHTASESFSLYLTDSKSNFRNQVATILPYKGGRKTEKPYHWGAIRQHLIDAWDAEVQYGIEADDRLGIEQCKNNKYKLLSTPILSEDSETIICSRDKDLHMIPGWHYSWQCGNQQERLWFQDATSSIRHFYKQLLTGDRSTDNILGLYGVGDKSQLVKSLESIDEESLMYKHVFKAYEDRFGSYASQFLLENAALLWMLREEPPKMPGNNFALAPEVEVEERLEKFLEEVADE